MPYRKTLATLLLGLISTGTHAEAPRISDVCPKYLLLRYNEDWSCLKKIPVNSPERDFWDQLKYMPFDSDTPGWLTLSLSERNRVESWDNFRFGNDNDTYDLNLLRVFADMRFSPKARAFIEVKSSLAGRRDLPGGIRNADRDILALQQGFVDLHPDEDKALTVRMGRFQMAFKNYRIVTVAPWRNTMRTWEGGDIIYKKGEVEIHAFATQFVRVRQKEPNISSPAVEFQGIHSALKQKPVGLDLFWYRTYFRNQAFQGPTVATTPFVAKDNRHTIGARIYHDSNKYFRGDAVFAYQLGRYGQKDIQAYMAGSSLHYVFSDNQYKPDIYNYVDYASGGSASSNTAHTYFRMFTRGHYHLGYMDYVGRQNILSIAFGTNFKPIRNTTLGVTVLDFQRANLDDALYLNGGAVFRNGTLSQKRNIGEEVDFYLRYKGGRHIRFLAGFSRFYPGGFIKDTGPSNRSQFIYSQVSYLV